jgi:AcrR family transcriptional regulator
MRVSEQCCLVFIENGFDLTVSELCERLGVPERTFYNYFPTKPDAVRPVLEAGIRVIAESLGDESLELTDAMAAGFARSLWGDHGVYTQRLVPLLISEPALYAVWLSTIRDFETALLPAVADRLGVGFDTLRARLLAATLVSAVRLSFEHMATHGSDPQATFTEAMAIVAPTTRQDGAR